MRGEICKMRFPQIGKSQHAFDTENGSRGGAQSGVGKRGSVVGKADQAAIKGGIP
jgi:hypothetical protein